MKRNFNPIIQGYVPYIIVVFSTISIVLLLQGLLKTSLILAILPIVLFLFTKYSSKDHNIDHETAEFVDNILSRLSGRKNVLNALKESLNPEFAFHQSMLKAINVYQHSGSTFKLKERAHEYKSEMLKEVVYSLISSMENGEDPTDSLVEIKSRFKEISKRKYSRGKIQSIDSIVKIGVIIFFPLFAGISLNIMNITSVLSNTSEISTSALFILLVFYIVSASNTIAKYGQRRTTDSTISRVSTSTLFIMFSLLIFRSSMFIGNFMLRW